MEGKGPTSKGRERRRKRRELREREGGNIPGPSTFQKFPPPIGNATVEGVRRKAV